VVAFAASTASSAVPPPAATRAAASTAKPSSMQLDSESTISMTAPGCRSRTWSRAMSALSKVPLILEESSTATTASPAETGPSIASIIRATEGCEDVGNSPVSRMAR